MVKCQGWVRSPKALFSTCQRKLQTNANLLNPLKAGRYLTASVKRYETADNHARKWSERPEQDSNLVCIFFGPLAASWKTAFWTCAWPMNLAMGARVSWMDLPAARCLAQAGPQQARHALLFGRFMEIFFLLSKD